MPDSQPTLTDFLKRLQETLCKLYPGVEIRSMGFMLLEEVLKKNKTYCLLHAQEQLSIEHVELLDKHVQRLQTGEPIQYVLGKAHFADLDLLVNASVLIPRPETEDLVDWIARQERARYQRLESNFRILDIGTGSGAIALALKKHFPKADVWAVDVSNEALQVAHHNAQQHGLDVHVTQVNILQEEERNRLPRFHCVVSNPPYVLESEQSTMHSNVLDHEPHLALFVPDGDALLFYRTIAQWASGSLVEGGTLYFEINAQKGLETVELLRQLNFSQVEQRMDLSQKDRFVFGQK